jgi:hemerythrin-like domain-containing protein
MASKQAAKDAIALLTEDHRQVKKMFKEYEALVDEDAPDDQKETVARLICQLLTVHATIEEEIFYPAAEAALEEEGADLLDEAEVEHASAKELIAQIESSSPKMPLYDARVIVLGEYVDHHVKEEENELFPKVKKSNMDVEAVGARLLERKKELLPELDKEPVKA